MKRILSKITRSGGRHKRDLFSSKLGVIAAAAGSAVGLGNIWRFPNEAGKYGGAAFVIVYLLIILTTGLPVMLSELIIGRKTRRNVYGAFAKLATKKPWTVAGYMGIGAAFMILAFYGVVAGWSFEYIIHAISGSFVEKSPADFEKLFAGFISSPFKPIFWQLLFMALTAFIVFSGIKNGIEKASKIMMPMLFFLIIILAVRAITLPGAMKGLRFLFHPDFSKLTPNAILSAMGQAFFSLSLGMGVLITYGSYIDDKNNLPHTALSVVIADVLIAILAGIAIFPAVFAFNIQPDQAGPGLVFITLPNVFQFMPAGSFFAVLFFVLLILAALTSSISILEVVVSYFVEEIKINRHIATVLATALISMLGMLCSLSFGKSELSIKMFGMSFFELFDFISSKILLPVGGLLIALFMGWYVGKDTIKKELSNHNAIHLPLFPVFLFLIRFVSPLAIVLIFLRELGFITL